MTSAMEIGAWIIFDVYLLFEKTYVLLFYEVFPIGLKKGPSKSKML